MRNNTTDYMGAHITRQYRSFKGTKVEFMAQLEGVTLDQRHEEVSWSSSHTYYYCCTIVRSGNLYEVYSYDEQDWFVKC